MSEPAEVVLADGGCCLDFESDDAVMGVFEREVYLDLVAGAVVGQFGWLIAPAELSRDLGDHKAFLDDSGTFERKFRRVAGTP